MAMHTPGRSSPRTTPVLAAILLTLTSACADTYDRSAFMATHNSYSGGTRRSIEEQLDHGVRVIELDVHLDGFAQYGYRVGHDGPGHQVSHEGTNPDTNALADWLALVAGWSANHPEHAPITLLVDFKDSLEGVGSAAEGNLAALNESLEAAFGDRLYTAEAFPGTWPLTEDLRGRVIVVLSGDQEARLDYLRDRGLDPAADMDVDGRIVELHGTEAGEIWSWTGRQSCDGTVRWARHARSGPGSAAAVALHDEGWVVAVSEEGDAAACAYRVGRLDDALEIIWSTPGALPLPGEGACRTPTVRFTSPGATGITEIHVDPDTGGTWTIEGTLDTGTGELVWGDPLPSPGTPLHDKRNVLLVDGRSLSVLTGPDGPFGADTLLYATGLAAGRIRYAQVAFSEQRLGDTPAFEVDGAPFFAAGAGEDLGRLWALFNRLIGRIVRLWGFNEEAYVTPVPVSFPATDVPFTAWYEAYAEEIGAVR